LRYAFLRDVESMTGMLLLPGSGGGNGVGVKGEDESGTTKATTAATTSLPAVGGGENVIYIDEWHERLNCVVLLLDELVRQQCDTGLRRGSAAQCRPQPTTTTMPTYPASLFLLRFGATAAAVGARLHKSPSVADVARSYIKQA
jgi:hypothetical protein